jgi:hypothetical protein
LQQADVELRKGITSEQERDTGGGLGCAVVKGRESLERDGGAAGQERYAGDVDAKRGGFRLRE